MNALDLLLGNNLNLEKPSKEFKIKRLSNEEQDFVLTLQAVTMNDIKHLRELYSKKDGSFDEVGFALALICYGVKEFDNRVQENKEAIQEICKLHGVANNMSLVNKIFLPGEINEIAAQIMDLSGDEDDAIEEIKNL